MAGGISSAWSSSGTAGDQVANRTSDSGRSLLSRMRARRRTKKRQRCSLLLLLLLLMQVELQWRYIHRRVWLSPYAATRRGRVKHAGNVCIHVNVYSPTQWSNACASWSSRRRVLLLHFLPRLAVGRILCILQRKHGIVAKGGGGTWWGSSGRGGGAAAAAWQRGACYRHRLARNTSSRNRAAAVYYCATVHFANGW